MHDAAPVGLQNAAAGFQNEPAWPCLTMKSSLAFEMLKLRHEKNPVFDRHHRSSRHDGVHYSSRTTDDGRHACACAGDCRAGAPVITMRLDVKDAIY